MDKCWVFNKFVSNSFIKVSKWNMLTLVPFKVKSYTSQYLLTVKANIFKLSKKIATTTNKKAPD